MSKQEFLGMRGCHCPNYVLNKKTIKILEESKLGVGVQSYRSLEELYKDLGI